MKELKFRYYCTYAKKVYFPEDWGNTLEGFFSCCWNGLSEEVMQYTGLKDKSGADIYEGDILEISGSEVIITVNDMAEFLLYCGEYKGKNGIDLPPLLKIIGDVYQEKE